jgi:hypothetical protein
MRPVNKFYKPPVRLVVSRRPFRKVGYLFSAKMGAMMGWESQLERSVMRRLEVDGNVDAYSAQPERMLLEIDGRICSYVPDLRVVRKVGAAQIIEVKPARLTHRNAALFEAARAKCRLRGEEFIVFSEPDLGSKERQYNDRLLGWASRERLAEEDARVLASALTRPRASLEAIAAAAGSAGWHACLGLVLDGRLLVDLDQAVGPKSRVIKVVRRDDLLSSAASMLARRLR